MELMITEEFRNVYHLGHIRYPDSRLRGGRVFCKQVCIICSDCSV